MWLAPPALHVAAQWAPLASTLLVVAWLAMAGAALLLATGGSSTGEYSKPGDCAAAPGRPVGDGVSSSAASKAVVPAWSDAQTVPLLARVSGLVQQLDAGACWVLPRVHKHWFWLFYVLGAPLALVALALTLTLTLDARTAATGATIAPTKPTASALLPVALAAAVPCLLLVHCLRRLAEHVAAGDVTASLRASVNESLEVVTDEASHRPSTDTATAAATDHGRAHGRWVASPPAAAVTARSLPTMGPVTYLGGLAHYILAPASALAAGIGARLPCEATGRAPEAWVPTAFAALAAGALALEAAQWVCHCQLRGLRHGWQASVAGGRLYVLPRGGAFDLCMSPHYAAEAASYWCWAALAALAGRGGTPAGALVWVAAAIWVSVNLAISGARTRKWYADKFGESRLAGRGAVLPACGRRRAHLS